MKITIDKELFQWEKGRYVFIELLQGETATFVQFYNSKTLESYNEPLINGRSKIPNSLLKNNSPIMAVVCSGTPEQNKVIARREFRVIKRAKPENYTEDEEDNIIHVIYDGGEEI